jgi:hypothetical protein
MSLLNKSLNNDEILKLFNKLEDKAAINEFNACGFNIWPIIRMSVCFGLISARYNKNTMKELTLKERRGYLYKSIRSLFRGAKKKKSSILFITHTNYLETINEVVYDRVHYGHVNRKISQGDDCIRLNLANKEVSYLNGNEKRLELFSLFRFIKFLSLAYCIFKIPVDWKTYKRLYSINKFFKSNGVYLTSTLLKIPFKVAYVFILSKFVNRSLLLNNVNAVYHSYYYCLECMAITLAARRCGIDTINVQHGVQAKYHPAFGMWDNVPKEGYELLPDEFKCWNKASLDVINNWALNNKHHYATVSSYHWADSWNKEAIPYNYNILRNESADYFNVLVTLQPSLHGIQDIVKECMQTTERNIKWWIRLHPRQLTNEYINDIKHSLKDYECPINIELASSKPLPAILSVIDLHITGFSSSIYEASYFSMKTILTHETGLDYYGDNLKMLRASYCADSECILTQIKEMLS